MPSPLHANASAPRSYDTVRAQIADGDVLLFEGHGFWSALIRAQTASRITHAAFALRVQHRLVCLEAAEGRGVQIWPLSDYLRRGLIVRWHRLRDHEYQIDRRAVVAHALAQWGKPYASWRQFARSWSIAGGVLRRVLGLAADQDAGRFFCSELVAESLKFGGWTPEANDPTEPARTSPGDLALFSCLQPEGVLTR